MSQTIYIAGKVSQLPIKEVRKKFADKQEELSLQGHTAINPVASFEVFKEQKMPESASWTEAQEWQIAMRFCLDLMLKADSIHLLPDWQFSRGATLEHNVALTLGIQVVYPD